MSSEIVAGTLRLPALNRFRVRVVAERQLEGDLYGAARTTAVPAILLGSACLDDHSLFVRTVSHELAHVYIWKLDPSLPDMLQEGIAEYVGISSQSPERERLELEHRVVEPPWPALLEVSFEELHHMPPGEDLRVRRASLELVLRIGFEELVGMLHDRELLERSLEAALDPATWPDGGARKEAATGERGREPPPGREERARATPARSSRAGGRAPGAPRPG